MELFFIWILVLGGIMYFSLIRPQQAKQKQHYEMVKGLELGDRIITAGGISGIIKEIVSENRVMIEVAEGVSIELLKNAIVMKDSGYEEDRFDLDEETVEMLEDGDEYDEEIKEDNQ